MKAGPCCEDRNAGLIDLIDRGADMMHVRIYVQRRSYGIQCKWESKKAHLFFSTPIYLRPLFPVGLPSYTISEPYRCWIQACWTAMSPGACAGWICCCRPTLATVTFLYLWSCRRAGGGGGTETNNIAEVKHSHATECNPFNVPKALEKTALY